MTDSEDGPLSDGGGTGESLQDDSDLDMLGSPRLSVLSDDTFSTPSKSFLGQNSPSYHQELGSHQPDLDLTLRPPESHDSPRRGTQCVRLRETNNGNSNDTVVLNNELNVTLTSPMLSRSPYKSVPTNHMVSNILPVT